MKNISIEKDADHNNVLHKQLAAAYNGMAAELSGVAELSRSILDCMQQRPLKSNTA